MYLLAQIWWLLLIAYVLGVLFGYVVWRACGLPRFQSTTQRERRQLDERVALLERDNARLEMVSSEAAKRAERLEAERASALAKSALQPPFGAPPRAPIVPRPLAEPVASQRIIASPATAAPDRPNLAAPALNGAAGVPFLSTPRNGKADNLRLIRGIGPRLEKILNSMGVFHFEQIAGWTEKDLALIDGYLGGFAGRALRDKWIDQSRKLAGLGGPGDNP